MRTLRILPFLHKREASAVRHEAAPDQAFHPNAFTTSLPKTRMEPTTFAELGLNELLLQSIGRLGYESPTPIQALTIPPALAGEDIVGLSQTGSGKTAAFTLPALQKLDLSNHATQVLIICPTRELCVQVCEEVHRLGADTEGLNAVPVYGGAPMDRQIRALRKGSHIVVGTPGRLLDHLRRGTFKTDSVRLAVLDEADRMLDMGFQEDMEGILSSLPPERQTLFFSATMNREVERLIGVFGKTPRKISVQKKELTVSSIDQSYYEVRHSSKVEVLSRLLDIESPRLAIVFCNTKLAVDDCCEALLARGYAADRLHGDVSQTIRERVLKLFREGTIELLVATDVAARGLDIEHVDVVFNYDLPYDPEDYVHRIGRTGRAGRSGKAVSFVFGREVYRLESIERYTHSRIRKAKVPTQEEVEGLRANKAFDTVKERLESGNFQRHENLADRLFDQGHAPSDIIGALFTLLRESAGRESEEIAEDSQPEGWESPRPPRQGRSRNRDHRGPRGDKPYRGKRERSDAPSAPAAGDSPRFEAKPDQQRPARDPGSKRKSDLPPFRSASRPASGHPFGKFFKSHTEGADAPKGAKGGKKKPFTKRKKD